MASAAIQSAIRLPTPEPGDAELTIERSSRKRSPSSRSPSPRRDAPHLRRRSHSGSPPPTRNGYMPRDVDRDRARERARQLEMRQKGDAQPPKVLTDAEKQAAAKAEYERLLTMRSGGTYIPPARLKALQAQITDKTSKEYQRMAWEALKKSINGLINKVNVSNIKHIVPELFMENLIRGRGLFCRSMMKAQAASLPFTPVLAAMAAIVNTKLPQVGELLISRLIVQFRKAFKRNDKSVCLSSTTFIAHLINQQVAHEMLAAQMLLLLLHKPTDDGVEIAVGLMKEVGQHIEDMNSQIALAVYDQFRSILHEADIDKRTQYMIEVLFQIRKDKYKDHNAIRSELDLVEEEDQITHRPGLDDQLSTEDSLNIFKFDPEYEANEAAYRDLKAEILGEGSGSEESDGSDGSQDEDEDEDEGEGDKATAAEKALDIKDQSNTDLVNLRRSIYLTIMSSGGFEEASHKLMRINLPTGREEELPSMIIECCSQERTYNKFFGLIGERFCKLNRLWRDLFETMFAKYYDTIHRYETNRLRIIAQFFGHLLVSDAIGWHVFSAVRLNEEDTTSSSRIFIKILIEDLAQGLGMKDLAARFKDDSLQPALAGMFPIDEPKDTRFSINFFTAIGMGILTEGMREWLKNMPKPAPTALPARSPTPDSRGRSASVSSYSSYSSRSYSRSPTRSPRRHPAKGQSISRSPSASLSPTRSRSYTPLGRAARRAQSYSSSRSRTPRKARGRSPSSDRRSQSPRRHRRAYSDSLSRSPSPQRRNARGPPLRRRTRSNDSRPSGLSRTNGKRLVSSDSRSPPPPQRRDRSYTMSRSPSRRSRNRRRSSNNKMQRTRRNTSSHGERTGRSGSQDSRTPSPPSRRHRSRSPPTRQPTRVSRDRVAPQSSSLQSESDRKAPAERNKESLAPSQQEDAMSNIHPSRRGLMGAANRAKASDFM